MKRFLRLFSTTALVRELLTREDIKSQEIPQGNRMQMRVPGGSIVIIVRKCSMGDKSE